MKRKANHKLTLRPPKRGTASSDHLLRETRKKLSTQLEDTRLAITEDMDIHIKELDVRNIYYGKIALHVP